VGFSKPGRKSSLKEYIYITMISRYKMGDTFISLPVEEVRELLASSVTKIEESVSAVEDKLGTVREEMEQLKVELYARFGKSINLET
jgi:prefoldin subunit 4